MSRFDRYFVLKITVGTRLYTFQSPLRISFNCFKSISGLLNRINLQIYNLAPEKRLAIVKDAEEQTRIPLELSIGYRSGLELVFKGSIYKCSNDRNGVDIVTTIECLDGGADMFDTFISKTVKGGTEAVTAMLQELPNVTKGKITTRPTLTRPKVMVGSALKVVERLVSGDENWYIDDEKFYILKDDEVTSNYVPVVQASTGLIGTPEREYSKVSFKMLIDPTIKIGRIVNLKSTVAPHLNGLYRLEDINYVGDNYGQDWYQTCTGTLTTSYKVI